MVLQEEQPQAYGNSSSLVLGSGHGGAGRGTGKHRPTKQPKQKKTPQRGLGVAQLERIRLEEQQKDAATTFAASSSSLAFSPGRAVPLPALPRAMTPFSTASDLNSAGSPPVPIPPNPFPDLFIPAPTLPLSGSTVASRANSTGHELLWNPLESSPGDVESRDIVFRVSQRRQQQQLLEQHLRKSSVNPSVLPLLSGVKLQMEPPSNQTHLIDLETPKEEKMVGRKRPRHFPFDGPSDYASFHSKLPLPTSSFCGADDFSSAGGDIDTSKCKTGATDLREGPPSCFGAFQVDWRNLFHPGGEKSSRESSVPAHGDFLTLGSSLASPPVPVPALPKLMQHKVARATIHCSGSSESGPVPYHETPALPSSIPAGGDETVLRFPGSERSSERSPFYSFLPTRPSNHETKFSEQRQEAADNLDLSLKL